MTDSVWPKVVRCEGFGLTKAIHSGLLLGGRPSQMAFGLSRLGALRVVMDMACSSPEQLESAQSNGFLA
jgi:hypothetical protein